jgi:hypothetical protein
MKRLWNRKIPEENQQTTSMVDKPVADNDSQRREGRGSSWP